MRTTMISTSGSSCGPVNASQTLHHSQKVSCPTRRALLHVVLQAPVALLMVNEVQAAATQNVEADNATSPYIQELLRKSIEKRDERAKQALKDYMKKNYKDYFQYEAGGKSNRGLSEESKQGIKKWLEENK